MADVGALWGVEEGVEVGVVGRVGGVEAVAWGGAFQDEGAVFLEGSAEVGGRAIGCLGQSTGLRGLGEAWVDALCLWGSAAGGCRAGDMRRLGGGRGRLGKNVHRGSCAHLGNARGLPGSAARPGVGVAPQGEFCRHRTPHPLDGTWICADGRGQPSPG